MKAIKPLIILLFTCFETLNIFSQTNAVLSYLPGDAKMIIKINPGSLGQKIKWEDLLKYKMFQDLMKEMPEEGKEFLNNSAHTGVDLSQGFFLVIPQNKSTEKLDPVFYGIPKDTTRITAMVKKIFPGKQPVKTGNGRLIIDKHTALAWNNEIVILTGDDAKKESVHQNTKTSTSAKLTRIKQLTDRCKMLLSKRQTAFNNEYFTSLIKEEGDLLLWMNNTIQSQPQKKNKTSEILGALNKNFMQNGNYTSTIINFQNGKVVAQMKRYVSTSLDSAYKKYPLRNINTELLKRLPTGHPIFIYSFSFSPEMIREMLVKTGADKLLDSISKKNIKIEDILPALKGDAMLAVMKVNEVAEEDSVTKGMNGLELFAAGSINDKEKFKNLAALLQTKKEDSAKDNSAKKPKPLIVSNDSIFVVSLSQIAGQKFLGSSGNNEEMEKLIDPYKNYPGTFILDLRTVFGFALQTMLKNKSVEEAKQASEVLGMFDKLVSYGGQYDTNSVSTTLELTLANKDENSLKQFINLINLFYSLKPKSSTAYNDTDK